MGKAARYIPISQNLARRFTFSSGVRTTGIRIVRTASRAHTCVLLAGGR